MKKLFLFTLLITIYQAALAQRLTNIQSPKSKYGATFNIYGRDEIDSGINVLFVKNSPQSS